jgi:hypothetical protein
MTTGRVLLYDELDLVNVHKNALTHTHTSTYVHMFMHVHVHEPSTPRTRGRRSYWPGRLNTRKVLIRTACTQKACTNTHENCIDHTTRSTRGRGRATGLGCRLDTSPNPRPVVTGRNGTDGSCWTDPPTGNERPSKSPDLYSLYIENVYTSGLSDHGSTVPVSMTTGREL